MKIIALTFVFTPAILLLAGMWLLQVARLYVKEEILTAGEMSALTWLRHSVARTVRLSD